MKSAFPEGAKVLFYRRSEAWTIITTFPNGYSIPANALAANFRTKPTLKDAYSLVMEHHTDEILSGGHEPGKDETSELHNLPEGAIVSCERTKNSWKKVIYYPDEGMSFRAPDYRCLGDIVEDVTLNFSVQ